MIELPFKKLNDIVFEKYRGGEKASLVYKQAGNKALERKAVEIASIGKAKIRCAKIIIGLNAKGEITGRIAHGTIGAPIHDYGNQSSLPWFPVRDTELVREGLIYQLYSPKNSREITGLIVEFSEKPITERVIKKGEKMRRDECQKQVFSKTEATVEAPGNFHHEPKGTEREAIIQSRIGQGPFRDKLIKLWVKCSVSGVDNLLLLRASHIKPWVQSTDEEKLDPYNGFLLIPNLDALFDAGLISFYDDGSIIISKNLSKSDQEKLGINKSMKLRMLFEQNKKYLCYHRENIFVK